MVQGPMQNQSLTAVSVDGNDSDSQLIAAALSGDQAAYTKLVHRYQGRFTSAIQNRVECSGIVDDIVQDAFMRAFVNLHSFRSESGFYTWLYRIALEFPALLYARQRSSWFAGMKPRGMPAAQ